MNNLQSANAGPGATASLRRLWSLVTVDRRLLWRGIFFQFWQSVSYIPFYAAVSLLIDRILNNAALSVGQKLEWIGIYALGNLLLWPVHGWFTVQAFAQTQRLVRSTITRLRRLVGGLVAAHVHELLYAQRCGRSLQPDDGAWSTFVMGKAA